LQCVHVVNTHKRACIFVYSGYYIESLMRLSAFKATWHTVQLLLPPDRLQFRGQATFERPLVASPMHAIRHMALHLTAARHYAHHREEHSNHACQQMPTGVACRSQKLQNVLDLSTKCQLNQPCRSGLIHRDMFD